MGLFIISSLSVSVSVPSGILCLVFVLLLLFQLLLSDSPQSSRVVNLTFMDPVAAFTTTAMTTTMVHLHQFSTTPTRIISSSSSCLSSTSTPTTSGRSNHDNSDERGKNNENDEVVVEEEGMTVIPDIEDLREEIRRLSKERSSEAPYKAGYALQEIFRYYNPKDRDQSNSGSGTNDDDTKRVSSTNSASNSGSGNGNGSAIATTEQQSQRQQRHQEQYNRYKIAASFSGQKQQHYNRDRVVDVIDCTQVINVWSKSRHNNAPQQVFAILQGMLADYQQNGNSCIRPNVFTYTAVINTYARRGDYTHAKDVFTLQLNDYKNQHNVEAKPNLYTFNAMIDACSKSNRNDIPEIAEQLLKTIQVWYERGDLSTGPDVITYSGVINCWSKSNRKEAPARALDILNCMTTQYNTNKNKNKFGNNIQPNTITYAAVMGCFAKLGSVVEETNAVFNQMKQDVESGNTNAKLNVHIYNMIIEEWCKSKSESSSSSNNTNSNNTNTNAALEKAESLLVEMIELYAAGKLEEDIKPNILTYYTVMKAFATMGDIEGTYRLFTMIQDVYRVGGNKYAKPTIRTYNILLTAWSNYNNHENENESENENTNSLNAPQAVNQLLLDMKQLYKKGDLDEGPNKSTYSSMIDCLQHYEGQETRIQELKIEYKKR